MNIGSGLGLLGLASFLCNSVILWYYGDKKMEVDKKGHMFLKEGCSYYLMKVCRCLKSCCCCFCCCLTPCCNWLVRCYKSCCCCFCCCVEEGAGTYAELPDACEQEQDDENITFAKPAPNYGQVQTV
ncbi:uncharacterized protein LOC118407153 [Branchiostoma floridae]|uniref:Uncharacterized protein LOC118407153 n=1 Tax=Branchiostoma floridae TaxID=7739 RepID=A0A9J7HSB5_BRAFL|nr:uncharacterized protein LOC118407153 [Branchiostoma floridae]